MEYILQNTDIFDERLGLKFSEIIKEDLDNFINGTIYKIKVTFHVNLLKDFRVEIFDVPNPYPHRTRNEKDKTGDVLSFQLDRIKQIITEKGIEFYSSSIQGDYLEAEDIMKIEISEDTSKPIFSGRGKNKKRMKFCTILLNKPSQLAIENLNRAYKKACLKIIRDKEVGQIAMERENDGCKGK